MAAAAIITVNVFGLADERGNLHNLKNFFTKNGEMIQPVVEFNKQPSEAKAPKRRNQRRNNWK